MSAPNSARTPAGMPPFVVPVVVLWFAASLFALWRLKPADPVPWAGAVCRGQTAAPASSMASATP